MKSRGLFGKKGLEIEIRDRDVRLEDDQHAIVRVRACGVCGTDVNFVRDWPDEPMPLGHEIAAEVMEIGRGVSHVQPGDRVIVEDCALCGICEACKNGRPDLCRNMFNLEGQPGMGQYLSVRSNLLDPFEGLEFVSACLTEPLAVSLTAVQQADIPLGGSVAVLGNGPLGLMAARLARLRGAGFVAISGLGDGKPISRARFEAAGELGCDLIIAVGPQSVEEEIKTIFPKGVDRVIVSSPPQSLREALAIVRFGGIISFFGLDFGGRNRIEVDVNDLIFRKITLRPAFAEPALNFPVSIGLLQKGAIDAKKLVTHTFGFERAGAIMDAIVSGSEPIIKAVMLPDRD